MGRVIVFLAIITLVYSLTVPTAFAQSCEGNFDCDQDVDGTDAAVFKQDFGRSPFSNPCPTCQENPCPCPEECTLSPCSFVDPFICQLLGPGFCACCIPMESPELIGICMDPDTCLSQPPHPLYGPWEPWF